MNDTTDKYNDIEPTLQECEPIDREIVWGQMQARRKLTDEYLKELKDERDPKPLVNDKLAPEQERVQVLHWNKQQGVFDVKLAPHWSAAYCQFPDDLCACNQQGVTKIGEYVIEETEGHTTYNYRKGYEDIEPLVGPSDRDVYKRWKELNAGKTEGEIRSETDSD